MSTHDPSINVKIENLLFLQVLPLLKFFTIQHNIDMRSKLGECVKSVLFQVLIHTLPNHRLHVVARDSMSFDAWHQG
jgi:hypothetical protein